jgi:hypothetical protein
MANKPEMAFSLRWPRALTILPVGVLSIVALFLVGTAIVVGSPLGRVVAIDAGNHDRGRIRSTLFVPEPLPKLKTESYGQFAPAPGVIAERVSYATGYGLRVPTIVYRPKNLPKSRMPGMVVVTAATNIVGTRFMPESFTHRRARW